jgi:hypothetical protein
MNNIENEVEMIIIHECNWNCPYCSEQTHQKSPLSVTKVFEKILGIRNGSNVTLSGGEPGLLSKDIICDIIHELVNKRCRLNINTNGLFIEKYPELLDYFDYILYHCSEDLIGDIKFYDYPNVYHSLVLTDDNICRFDGMIKKYPSVKWNVIPSSIGDYDGIPILSGHNKRKLLKKYGDHLTQESKYRLIVDKDWSKIRFI